MGETRADLPLVEGRTCGACTACCRALTIDEPAMQKLPGVPCVHLDADRRCGIYETRYRACRAFHCGYRLLPWLPETMRPDQAGVLVLPPTTQEANGDGRLSAAFMILTHAALDNEGLAQSIIAAVRAEVAVFLSVPGPPGTKATRTDLTDAVMMPALLRSRSAVLAVVRETYERAKRVERPPVVFKSAAAPQPE